MKRNKHGNSSTYWSHRPAVLRGPGHVDDDV